MSFVNTVNPNGGVVYRRVMKNHFQTINYWNVFFRQKHPSGLETGAGQQRCPWNRRCNR